MKGKGLKMTALILAAVILIYGVIALWPQGKKNDISMRTLDAYDIKQAKNLCDAILV